MIGCPSYCAFRGPRMKKDQKFNTPLHVGLQGVRGIYYANNGEVDGQ